MDALSQGVCSIKIAIPEINLVIKGTGFHYGSGWVMSNAHVFQYEGQDTRNLINKAKFTFGFGGNQRVFGPLQPDHHRTAFIHKLPAGGFADIDHDVDIAMIKLGNQYEYGRTNFLDWETTETAQLHLPVFASLDQAPIEIGSIVQAMYPVGEAITTVNSEIIDLIEGEQLIEGHSPVLLKLNHNVLELPPGSSGCPIVKSNNIPLLVGLHFAGEDTTSWALHLKSGIAKHFLEKGVEIIALIGRYIVFGELGEEEQQNAENEKMSDIANNYNIDIYLPNGETIIAVAAVVF